MNALFLLVWGLAGLVQDQTQRAEPSAPGAVAIASERRMFDMRSREAWDTVRKGLDGLGLPADQTDRSNQVVLTKWRDVGAKGLEWLPVPQLSEIHQAKRIRFLLFVSPFAEPARIYISSEVEADEIDRNPPRRAIGYNVSNANKALMDQIVRLVGRDRLPIPTDAPGRRRLALSLLKDEADDCLRRDKPPEGAPITRPQNIPLTKFTPVYPTPAQLTKTQGTVRVEFVINEDGGVTNINVLDAALGRQLEASAIGVASLLSYSPARMGGCAISAILTYNVQYRLE